MTAERERTLAGAAVVATILAWFGVALTMFYVPRLSQLWAELAAPLSPAQKLLLTLSGIVQHSLLVVAPVLLAATAAAFWWRIHTGGKMHDAAQGEIR
jgi:type II secretory pathway component PulF